MEIQSSAHEAWALYGAVGLTVITVPKYLAAVDIVEGDGGEGSIAKLTPLSGSPYYEKFTKVDDKHMLKETEITEGAFLDMGFTLYRSPYYEKFTKVDDKHMVKETEIIEGAFLDFGFTLYRVRFENMPTGEHSCITRTTIEWEVKEEYVANSSLVSILPSINIAKDIEACLLANEENDEDSK
ncbi:hypothetical protein RJ639_023224 [Escallonia herrerae]|uniref:Bet v I/Major latex protein domain-containing protein n=1 Tax=Escallonia herrerae TaxID=1293975 RepID=A0AA88UZ85_9ASTE|nr:hypothetical protein RJ639_023224 [Escallonia herrerae]